MFTIFITYCIWLFTPNEFKMIESENQCPDPTKKVRIRNTSGKYLGILSRAFKGTISRDFRLLVFFYQTTPHMSRINALNHFANQYGFVFVERVIFTMWFYWWASIIKIVMLVILKSWNVNRWKKKYFFKINTTLSIQYFAVVLCNVLINKRSNVNNQSLFYNIKTDSFFPSIQRF
jgi:hypothetical protein